MTKGKQIYTMEQWAKDGSLDKDGSINIEVGQEVSNEVILELKNCVPPAYLGNDIFQRGEPFCVDAVNPGSCLYFTFTHDGEAGNWIYRGLCLYGHKTPREGLYIHL